MISEISVSCLLCACEDGSNDAARALLRRANALSAIGVLAALFISNSAEREDLIRLARATIRMQRQSCAEKGPFAERCPTEISGRRA